MSTEAPAIALLEIIPGVSRITAEVIVAETGADMSRFPTPGHLCAWAGVAPASNESAGKHRPAGTRKGQRWLRRHLIEAARAASRTKDTYLSAHYQPDLYCLTRRTHGMCCRTVLLSTPGSRRSTARVSPKASMIVVSDGQLTDSELVTITVAEADTSADLQKTLASTIGDQQFVGDTVAYAASVHNAGGDTVPGQITVELEHRPQAEWGDVPPASAINGVFFLDLGEIVPGETVDVPFEVIYEAFGIHGLTATVTGGYQETAPDDNLAVLNQQVDLALDIPGVETGVHRARRPDNRRRGPGDRRSECPVVACRRQPGRPAHPRRPDPRRPAHPPNRPLAVHPRTRRMGGG